MSEPHIVSEPNEMSSYRRVQTLEAELEQLRANMVELPVMLKQHTEMVRTLKEERDRAVFDKKTAEERLYAAAKHEKARKEEVEVAFKAGWDARDNGPFGVLDMEWDAYQREKGLW